MLDFILGIPSTPYNLANASNITDFGTWLTFTNELSNYTFGWLTVVAIFIIIYITTSRRDTSSAFITASFGGFMSAMFLAMLSMVDPAVVVIMLFMLAVGVGWGITKKD